MGCVWGGPFVWICRTGWGAYRQHFSGRVSKAGTRSTGLRRRGNDLYYPG